jgi:DMSO reductase anchor subunit
MCQSRLAANEAPACVQACPSGAITIRIVSKSEVTKSTKSGAQLLPGAFDSHYTKPTTSYTTRKSMPANARPGDATALRLEHAHWPLIGMLVLTQIATGLFGAASLTNSERGALNVAGLILLHLGLGVSVLHLGRPLGAWRAFLGLRTSWMSREIFAFSAFAGIAVASTLSSLWPWFASHVLALQAVTAIVDPARFATPLAHATTALGLFSVFCSAMIYVDTRRLFWSREQVFTKFFGTSLLLGAAGAAMLLAWSESFAELTRTFAIAATIIRTALFGWEFQTFYAAWRNENDSTHRSALTMWQLLRPLVIVRVALFFVSTAFGVLAISHTGSLAAFCATLSFGFTALSQLIERYLFFTAVVAPRMPGPLAPSHS